VIRSLDELARAPCFSGSCASLITGFTCGTFNLELVKLDVVDCIHDTISWGPMTKALELFAMTKMTVVNERSHEDFYRVDSEGSLRKGD